MTGSDYSTTTLKEFSGFRQEESQRNKLSNGQTESAVRLWTARGRIDTVVEHAVVAARDAVIDMARREAAVPPEDFQRGEVQ